MSPTEKQSFGMNGCELVPQSTTSSSGAFCAVQFITEGTIASITTSSLTLTESVVTDFTFPAGFVLYIPFTSITTGASAAIVIYKSSL